MSSPTARRDASPRIRLDDRLLLRVATHLTERDRVIIRILYEHRVLTSLQVCDVAFDSVRRAEARLRTLHQLRVVDRFRPHQWPGSAPYHWILDRAGAAVMAAEEGRDLDALSWRHERGLALATSATLQHRVACNGFFAALLREARLRPDRSLAAWWSAWRCAQEWGRMARPDGYAVWTEEGVRLPFLLEYDRGTESGKRLTDKLPGYRDLLSVSLPPTWLLFCFESPRREVEARKVLRQAPANVATGVLSPKQSPADALWLPRDGTHRLRLTELVSAHPGPARPDE